MDYRRLDYESLRTLCTQVFHGYGFSEDEAREITDALLAADLFGIESHGIQRLVRYDYEINSGMVDIHAEPERSMRLRSPQRWTPKTPWASSWASVP